MLDAHMADLETGMLGIAVVYAYRGTVENQDTDFAVKFCEVCNLRGEELVKAAFILSAK